MGLLRLSEPLRVAGQDAEIIEGCGEVGQVGGGVVFSEPPANVPCLKKGLLRLGKPLRVAV